MASIFTYCFVAGIIQVQVSCSNITLDKGSIKMPLKLKSGRVFTTLDECHSPCGVNDWLSWGEWSLCDIPIPGNPSDKPQCYNSLQNRKRFCSNNNSTCTESNWKLCLDKESCTGQWSQWTTFNGNCSKDCTTPTRNRTCMDEGRIAPGLCYPSSYGSAIDIEVKACSEGECKTNAMIYTATFLIRIILFIATIACSLWAKRRSRSERKNNRTINKSRRSLTFRHYSFAIDNADLQVAGSTDDLYEETCVQPIISDIQPYASTAEIQVSANEHVYETPTTSTSLKSKQCNHIVPPTTGPRSRSVDDMIAKRSNCYENIQIQCSAASERCIFSSHEDVTSDCPRMELASAMTINNNKESEDDIYTPMSSLPPTDVV